MWTWGWRKCSRLGRAIRATDADADLVIVIGRRPAFRPDIEIRPWTLLRKPFYLPELLDVLDGTPAGMLPVPTPEITADCSRGKALTSPGCRM